LALKKGCFVESIQG